jgi:hypothetical protein
MLRRLLYTPLWDKLRSVSNSTAAKATILVPVIGYLIIFNEKIVEFLNLARVVEARSGSEVSYRLILIYLGLCAISLGVVIYGWFCPVEVKHYGSAAAYVQGDGPSLRGFVIDEIGKLLEGSPLRDRLEECGKQLNHKHLHSLPISDDELDRYRIEVLHLHFEYLNLSHPLARSICFWTYVVGFGLLAVPSSIVFTRVVHILLEMIF